MIPTLTAATWSRSGDFFIAPNFTNWRSAAGQSDERAGDGAQRVPPSAWRTSQSSTMLRSPSASRSTTLRKERPISRWISMVRPEARPLDTSRGRARRRGARQHGILGGHPALAGAAQEAGHGIFDGRGAQHPGVAGFDQHGAFRGEQIVRRDFQRAELVG